MSCLGKGLGNYFLNGRERSKAKKETREGKNAPIPSTLEYLILQHTQHFGFSTNTLTTVKKNTTKAQHIFNIIYKILIGL